MFITDLSCSVKFLPQDLNEVQWQVGCGSMILLCPHIFKVRWGPLKISVMGHFV